MLSSTKTQTSSTIRQITQRFSNRSFRTKPTWFMAPDSSAEVRTGCSIFWHSVGNRLLTLLSNCLTNINLSDMETCYKAFRREVIQSIPIEEDRFGFEPEITVKIAKRRLRIYEVGIGYSARTRMKG